MVSINGRIFFSVGNGEQLANDYTFYGTTKKRVPSNSKLIGTNLYSKFKDAGKKVYTNAKHPEVIYVEGDNINLYDVYVENSFYLLHLIHVESNVYVSCADLLTALEFKKDVGDISWVTSITKKGDITTDYSKNIDNYESLGPLSCSDEYGMPTIDMTCPGWSAKGIIGNVFRNTKDGYLVVGEINQKNELNGTKYMLNQP